MSVLDDVIDPVAEFRKGIHRLYEVARRPKYRALAEHADRLGFALRPSTTSDLLNGIGIPRWETVAKFVRACARHCDTRKIGVAGSTFDVERWYADYQSMENALIEQRLRQEAMAQTVGRRKRGSPVTPAQLPRAPLWFTGRTAELDRLLETVSDSQQTSAVVISAIDGMAGIGKTALAVHVAHRTAPRYPDGQLFLDLHGFTEGSGPLEAGEALDRMLRDVGIPGEQIPAELEARAGLWRSLLADRRMLIVLDNAAAEQQVEPLIPGTPGSLILVTSRRRLTGLEVTCELSLDVLPINDSVSLFARIAGRDDLQGEAPELLAEVVTLCGRLPLAIKIAAARLRSRPAWTLLDLLERLRDQDQRLLELADRTRSITAALGLSYEQLPADQQLLYRLLGLNPGSDIESSAAAALAGVPVAVARRLLDQLVDVRLAQEPTHGRYTMHDLVRTHASRIVTMAVPQPDRQEALLRLLDHYRHTAAVAMDIAHPYERGRRPQVPGSRTARSDLRSPAAASGWLDVELPNLMAVARCAAKAGWSEHVWHLSAILARHLRVRGRYRDAESLHGLALAAARAVDSEVGEFYALVMLGHTYRLRGHHAKAKHHYVPALELAHKLDHQVGTMMALDGLGNLSFLLGRHQEASAHFQQMLDIAGTVDDPIGELEAHLGLGDGLMRQDRHQQSAAHYHKALEIARKSGHQFGALSALNGLGEIRMRQKHHEHASHHFREALETATAIGHRVGEMVALGGLANLDRLSRRYQSAATNFEAALEAARAIGHQEGELSALNGLGRINWLQGYHGLAREQHQQVLHAAERIGDLNWQYEATLGLGRVHHAAGDLDLALDQHLRALKLATELDQPADKARAYDCLARVSLALDHHEQARQHWQDALDTLISSGIDHTEDTDVNIPNIRSHLAKLS